MTTRTVDRPGAPPRSLLLPCTLAALFAVLVVAYFAFGGYRNWPYKVESDGKYYYHYLVSLLLDGDLDFANQYRTPQPAWMQASLDPYGFADQVSALTGRPANVFYPGPASLWAPFFAIAAGLGRLFNLLGAGIDLSPYGRWCQYGTMLAGPVLATASLGLIARLARAFGFRTAGAVCAALAVALFASPLAYYAVFEPSMSHVHDLFAYCGFLVALSGWLERARPRDLGLAVGFGALAVLIRPQNALTLAVFAGLVALIPARLVAPGAATTRARLAGAVLPLAAGVAPVLALLSYLYGSPFTLPQGEGFLNPLSPEIGGVLFSWRNGLFSHHPALLAGFAGFVALAALRLEGRARWLAVAMLIAFGLQVHVNASARDWWAGHSLGQRRLLSSLPPMAVGLAFAMERAWAGGAALRTLAATLSVAACLFGLGIAGLHAASLWDYDEPHDLVEWTFRTGPEKVIERFRRTNP